MSDHLPPEVKAQLEEQKKQCPFCKIISGEIPAKLVYKDKLMAGVLDINPVSAGHTLLMPIEHYPIMPFLPPDTFKHIFGLMPRFVGALKKAMLCTGLNITIANGGVAGQQSPHFLIHLIPRERSDFKDKYSLDEEKGIDEQQLSQINSMLAQNIPQMMKNHFQKQPAAWSDDKFEDPENLQDLKGNSTLIYEDEKALCISPKNSQCIGHLVIYPKEELYDFEKLDFDSSSHLFYLASYCATAVFEGLKAQGSNIIVKIGASDDNPTAKISVHVLPRFQGDGLDFVLAPLSTKPDMDDIHSKIKDKLFYIEHDVNNCEKKDERICIDLDVSKDIYHAVPDKEPDAKEKQYGHPNPDDEIKEAIRRIKEN